MTNDDFQKVARIIQTLDHFAATSDSHRVWHIRWQQVYEQVLAQIKVLVEEPNKTTGQATKS